MVGAGFTEVIISDATLAGLLHVRSIYRVSLACFGLHARRQALKPWIALQGRVVPYEYSDQELDDGEVVINWLSRQDWSTGKLRH